jgi:prophage tail gpP-like protein
MPKVSLNVNGLLYEGWKDVSITRGIECLSGAFDLAVSERWAGQKVKWPINEGDECSVSIEGQTLITGYIDQRHLAYTHDDHSISVSGRDKAADLVDSSALLNHWEFLGRPADRIVRTIAEPFLGKGHVTLAAGIKLPTPQMRFPVNPGETAFEAVDRICRLSGLLAMSDGVGGIILTRAGTSKTTTPLIEGENILAASSEYNHSQRFYKYLVGGQHVGNDEFFGAAACGIDAFALDKVVRKTRVLMVRAEGIVTPESAKRRAEWEATIRAARAGCAEVTVRGWTQADGSVWPINALVVIKSPMLELDGEMLITQAVYKKNDQSGTITTLSLKRPDAFTPEPVIEEDPWSLSDADD